MSSTSLDVAIAAGGTAGHINPALALAEELTRRGHHVTFYGQSTRLEAKLVPAAGFDFRTIEVSGFDRSRPWTLVSAVVRMRRAQHELDRLFASQGRPDVAVGFGAYVELPLMQWCRDAGVPYVLHEQNSVPGLANKMASAHATTLCLAFPAAKDAFADKVGGTTKVCVTGNPVRESVTGASRADGRQELGASDDDVVLLVFGGSLGARHLNDAVCALKDQLLAHANLRVVQSTGAEDFERVSETLALTDDEATRWDVRPYIDNMGACLAAADLVVSRSGASSCAEIAACAVPSILVPYPHATADHQTTNAHLLVDAGAAVMFADADIDDEPFSRELLSLVENAERRAQMRDAATSLAQGKAASRLADEVETAIRGAL